MHEKIFDQGLHKFFSFEKKKEPRLKMIRTMTSDIMLRQDLSNAQTNACGSLPTPRWVFAQPTPLLIQKGLTATVLQQELQIINDKSADWYIHYILIYSSQPVYHTYLPNHS